MRKALRKNLQINNARRDTKFDRSTQIFSRGGAIVTSIVKFSGKRRWRRIGRGCRPSFI
jgi:hypothetical protein